MPSHSSQPLCVVQLIPAMQSGGVERGTLEVARALVEAGHQAIVISAGGEMVRSLEAVGAEHIQWPIGKKSVMTLRWVPILSRWLENTRVDILHARSRLPAWIGYLAWRHLRPNLRPRFITTVHGLYSVNRYSEIMTRSERIIAVSRAAQDYIVANYPRVARDRIELIPRGVDPCEFPYRFQPSAAWQQTWNEAHTPLADRWILTLPGRLTRLKGHLDFLQIIEWLKDQGLPVHGLIVGGKRRPNDRYARKLCQEVKVRALPITFLGPRTDIQEIYAISNVVLSLSHSPESFGRTVLEALSLGTPVVGYAHGGVDEILERVFPMGQIAPHDLNQATKKLMHFYRFPPTVPPDQPFKLAEMLDSTLALYSTLRNTPVKEALKE